MPGSLLTKFIETTIILTNIPEMKHCIYERLFKTLLSIKWFYDKSTYDAI